MIIGSFLKIPKQKLSNQLFSQLKIVNHTTTYDIHKLFENRSLMKKENNNFYFISQCFELE